MELDALDKLILKRLQEDARRSFKEIADEAKVSETTIFSRVTKLRKIGVIKGFSAVIDPSLVGKGTTAIILVKADPKAYRGVLEELAKIKGISEVYDVTGPCYAVLKVRASGTEDLATIIDKIGSVSGIIGTETAVVLRTIKEDIAVEL
jgi:DNA-binding Lrp family transcriptional regulator